MQGFSQQACCSGQQWHQTMEHEDKHDRDQQHGQMLLLGHSCSPRSTSHISMTSSSCQAQSKGHDFPVCDLQQQCRQCCGVSPHLTAGSAVQHPDQQHQQSQQHRRRHEGARLRAAALHPAGPAQLLLVQRAAISLDCCQIYKKLAHLALLLCQLGCTLVVLAPVESGLILSGAHNSVVIKGPCTPDHTYHVHLHAQDCAEAALRKSPHSSVLGRCECQTPGSPCRR